MVKYYKEYEGETLFDEYPESKHFAVTSTVNLIKRNPYVFVATGLAHAGYHYYESRRSGASTRSTPTSTKASKHIIPLAKEFVVKKAMEEAVSYAWRRLEDDYYCPHDDGSTLCSKSKDHRGRHRHKKHGRRRY